MSTILVVDDEKDMRTSLTNILESDGHSVIDASNGKTALEKIEKEKPDVVLLDLCMPEMDGMQTLNKIKEIDSEIPVIMITGYGSTRTSVEIMKLGAVDYFSKPFDYEEVLNAIRKSVQIKELKKGSSLFEKQSAKELANNKSEEAKLQTHKTKINEKTKYWFKFKMPILVFSLLFLTLIVAGIENKYYWKVRTYEVPYSNVSALANDGRNLWVNDWVTNIIYKQSLDRNLSVVQEYRFPDMHLTGIALDSNYLFSCDLEKKQIHKHRLDDALTIVSTYTISGTSPSGLFWDGKYLWSCDTDTDKIYKHIITDGKLVRVETYSSPGSDTIGLYHDSEYFWSADAGTNKVYKHELDKSLSVVATYKIPRIEGAISAFTLSRGAVWVTVEETNKIYSYNIRSLEKVSQLSK
ncbi:MAG: response regulator [Candidatus Firestonebacteria bacterium]